MRVFLLNLSLLLACSVHAQQGIKPVETHISFSLFTNHQTPSYSSSELGPLVGREMGEAVYADQYWNQMNSVIRSYSFGAATHLIRTRNLASEWFFNLTVTGQFQHKHLFTGKSENLLEHVQIDSVNSVKTFESSYLAVSEFNDLILIQPGITFKHLLNRRWNVNGALQLGLGAPLKTAFERIELIYNVERRMVGDEVDQETRFQDRGIQAQDLVAQPFYLATNVDFSPGLEYRVLDHRSIFLGTYAHLGKQFVVYGKSRQTYHYSGGEIRLTSRF